MEYLVCLKVLVLISLLTLIYSIDLAMSQNSTAWPFGPKPPNATCLFLCPVGWCYNGGTCTINEFDCSFVCTCVDGFMGHKCKTSITPGPSFTTDHSTKPTIEQTTLRHVAIRTCLPGFVCQHGYCQTGSIKCLCDEGWTGAFCETKLQNTCDLKCDEGLVCKFIVNSFKCVKILLTNSSESQNETETTASTEATVTTQINTTQLNATDEQTEAPLDTTTLRPLSERQCALTFVCKHGFCAQPGLPSCICDPKWKGPFCDVAYCFPNCGNDSECRVISEIPQCVSKSYDTTTSTITQTTKVHTPANLDSTTLRNLSERTCFQGYVCEHGFCQHVPPPFLCVCDPGWDGAFCQTANCSPDCINGQECHVISGKPVCTMKHANTSIVAPITSSTTMPTTEVATTDDPDDECSAYNFTLRPYHERFCVPGFVCKYGYCNKTDYSGPTGSGLHLDCICDEGVFGPQCEYKCCLNCSGHGSCYIQHHGEKIGKNVTQVCLCQHEFDYKYVGQFCENRVMLLDPKGPTWWLYVVIVCIIVLVILVLMVIVIPYWMWRNRVTMVMKIVHFFQPYEDDDDRIWDAFISYKSSEKDEQFVLRQLYPKLEKELGFKLCMHQRDFIPGETIANNIINAVNNSRRTILVLTPRYVESEFTRFEYQMAQQEMLKKKHRIIPVLLEDITYLKESMDPNLKQIIGSVTYLEYPCDSDNEKKEQKFWKRLELSLPKKRNPSTISSSPSAPSYIDSNNTDKIDSDKIQISIIDKNKTEEKSKSSDMKLDVIKLEQCEFSDDVKNSEPDICLDVLKLPLDRNDTVDLEKVNFGFEKDKNENSTMTDNALDVRLNIEKYMSMMEGTSC